MLNVMSNKKTFDIIVAPNSFKGSLSGIDAAQAISDGIKESGLNCKIRLFPVADGGSDTMQLLTKISDGEFIEMKADDPLGKRITCKYGWVEDKKTAIVGLSEASGLQLFNRIELEPLMANTYGTGEQIQNALEKGAKKIFVAVGGSATTDGGSGLLQALGLRLLDQMGAPLKEIPKDLLELEHLDLQHMDCRIKGCRFTVLCDVKNQLLGTTGAATVFAPQKGANEEQVSRLEKSLHRWNCVTLKATGKDMSKIVSGGAAGGSAAGMAVFLDASCVSGIDYILDHYRFDNVLKKADYVITAEGKIDSQTLEGKGPFGVALRAAKHNVPVIAFGGEVQESSELKRYFAQLISINQSKDLKKEIANTAHNLRESARRWGEEVKRGA